MVGAIPVAPTASDETPEVAAEIQAKPDVIVDGLTTDLYTKFILGMRAQGSQIPFIIASGDYSVPTIKADLPGVANLIVDGQFDQASPTYATFLQQVKQYDPNANVNENWLYGWTAVREFAYAAEHAASLTRSAIAAEMSSITDYSDGGIIPPLNYTQPQKGFGGAVPRLVNDAIVLYHYQGGALVPLNGGAFVHAFS